MTFRKWLVAVDHEINSLCGLVHSDLVDQCWRDWYNDGLSPREAAGLCLDDEGFPFDALL